MRSSSRRSLDKLAWLRTAYSPLFACENSTFVNQFVTTPGDWPVDCCSSGLRFIAPGEMCHGRAGCRRGASVAACEMERGHATETQPASASIERLDHLLQDRSVSGHRFNARTSRPDQPGCPLSRHARPAPASVRSRDKMKRWHHLSFLYLR